MDEFKRDPERDMIELLMFICRTPDVREKFGEDAIAGYRELIDDYRERQWRPPRAR